MKTNLPKHILVIRLSAMGDVAMTVPVLREVSKNYPEIKITVLSRAFLKPLFDDIQNVSFYAADVNGKHKGASGLFTLYKELKQLNIDAVADLHDVLRSKILRTYFKIGGIKTFNIDKGRKEKKALTKHENKVFKQLKTTHERYANVFRSFGFKIDLSNPIFPSKQSLPTIISEEIHFDEKDILIGIAPFAQHQPKMYPLDQMEIVISKLEKEKNVKVLLFGGGKKEVELLNKVSDKFDNVYNVAGKIKLKDELALISNLNCMLSMDSGNGHFSAMLGIPTITIWGATHPYAGFIPFAQNEENWLLPDLEKYPKIPTSIYGNKQVEGYEDVMLSISPEAIVNKIKKYI
ncbi:glycosyltransferase family 9 protein [Aureivirga sp. CE67]|uniref:glycosyltransferase family 9 protein n=1 Tax=Aureivirga sp. CE67 TaxID=1788983 RepID=UPI001E4E9525|nr:glycosyltransferase family 9 protein [Aureivirga sp. CE67]